MLAGSQKPMCIKLMKIKVDCNTGCHIWTGSVDKNGYGIIGYCQYGKKQKLRAHRMAYQQYVGPVDDTELVLHSCNNEGCINPDHLYIGTAKENIADAVQKPGGFYKTTETRQQASEIRTALNKAMPQKKDQTTGRFIK